MWTISRACVLSTFSQEQGAEPLADYYLAGIPYAPSSSTGTAAKCSSPARTTVPSIRSRYGTTSGRLRGIRGEDALMSLLVDSLVRTYPLSGNEGGSKERSHASGGSSRGLSEKSALSGFSPRTRPTSFGSGSTSSYRILTRSGMMRSGCVSPRPSVAPPTSETGFGYWAKDVTRKDRSHLKDVVMALNRGEPVTVPQRDFEFWPTPTYSDARNYGTPNQLLRNYIPLSTRLRINPDGSWNTALGRANPRWTAWLMGWPDSWTSLEPMETDRFRAWLRAHSWSSGRDLKGVNPRKQKERKNENE